MHAIRQRERPTTEPTATPVDGFPCPAAEVERTQSIESTDPCRLAAWFEQWLGGAVVARLEGALVIRVWDHDITIRKSPEVSERPRVHLATDDPDRAYRRLRYGGVPLTEPATSVDRGCFIAAAPTDIDVLVHRRDRA